MWNVAISDIGVTWNVTERLQNSRCAIWNMAWRCETWCAGMWNNLIQDVESYVMRSMVGGVVVMKNVAHAMHREIVV